MPKQSPPIAFAIEVGPQNRPIMKVRVKEQEIPLDSVDLAPAIRLRVWQKTGGVCVLCQRRIDGVQEPWITRETGPAHDPVDEFANLGPAHASCATEGRAEARDQRQGSVPPKLSGPAKRSLPFGRKSPLKRKVTGEVVKQ
jgi:hypothetical protein